jgi:Flp pilus assembly protein TadG
MTHASPCRPAARGQSLAEFALVLPILMLILMGIIQLGILFGAQIGVINGVRETARYGSLSPTTAGNQTANGTAVVNHLQNVVLPGSVIGFSSGSVRSPSATYCSYANPGGGTYSVRLTVTVTYAHPLFIPLIGAILDPLDGASDGAYALSTAERFRVENLPLNSSEVVGMTACP